jgi:TonB family protein
MAENCEMGKKLLLVEYEPRYIDKVRASAGTDYQLTVAREGDEAIAAFDRERPDAILISAVLPKSRANDVIRELRRRGGPLAPPILLMMSGYKGSNPRADAQRIGAFDILEKPFTEERLRELVSEAIQTTDPGKTIRIDTRSPGTLTSSEIFSEVLQDLQPEKGRPAAPPAPLRPTLESEISALGKAAPETPKPAEKPAATAVEKRLEDTLSGILAGVRKSAAAPAPAAVPKAQPAAPGPAGRQSTDLEVEHMISQTLSGLALSGGKAASPRPVAEATPTPRPAPERPTARPVAPGAKDRFGQFQLIEKIATGGMAEVYKARMSGVDGFQKIVAIKKILPHMAASEDFITMFADEAKLAAQLNHPNIIHIYDLGKVEDSYYIAMEYVEGRDLRSILKSGAAAGLPLPPELALFVASKLAAALDYAHRRKDFDGKDLSLVHRDVSPQNVLISYEGDIKLCDFGIAKAASKSSQTQAGALKGKLQYMSPEQASGRPIDRRSDLFSLGTVLYEMLAREKLFSGDTDLSILEQVRTARIASPSAKNPDIPKRVDAIVLKALARNPEERYQNASDFQRDLESVLYSYSPAPGSADLAIYLHHLQAEEKAASEESERAFEAAFTPVPAEPARPKKAKGTAVQRKTGGTPAVPIMAPAPAAPAAEKPVSPAPAPDTKSGVFGAFGSKRLAAERVGRATLVAGIGLAAVVLAGVYFYLSRRPASPRPAGAKVLQPAAATASAAQSAAATATASTASASPPALTQKQVEEEVKKQVALKQKELDRQAALQKARAAKSAASEGATATAPPPAASAAAPAAAKAAPAPTPVPLQVGQASGPALAVPKRIEPPPEPPAVETSDGGSEAARSDIVGPGPGVVEPEIASKLQITYPLGARQEWRLGGRVVILALIDESGNVSSARVQTGVASRSGVNEAILAAVKRAKFRPATKDGVPVKMYKAIPVDVAVPP